MVQSPPSLEAPDTRDVMLAEKRWRILLAFLSGAVLIITIYCLANGITTIFMHLYYFPIILLSYHYQRTGVILSALLGGTYVAIAVFYTYPEIQEMVGAVERFFVFVCISLVVAYLSSLLSRREQSCQTIFSSAGESILYITPKLIITDVNTHCQHLLGYERDTLIGTPLETICIDHNGEAFTPEAFTLTSPDESREVRIIARDGSEKVAILTAGILPDTQYVLTLTDISGQIQLKDEIQQLNVLQENIIANANVWLMVLDKKGQVLIWNEAAEVITGYPAEEVVGSTHIWKQLYPDADYRRSITETINDIIQTGSYLRNFETTIVAQNGTQKIILWNTRLIPAVTADEGASYVAIGVDITGRVTAENGLRENELKLNAVFNQSYQMIGLLAPDGTVLKINQTALTAGSVTEEDVVGKLFWENIWWAQSPEVQEQIRDAVHKAATGGQLRFESTMKGPEGNIHTIDFSIQPVKDETGRVVFLIPEAWDISDRKKAENEMNRAFVERSALLNEIHHRVYNNLQVLLSMITLEEISHQDELAINPLAETLLLEMEKRIRAIALVHENMYRSDDLTGIRLRSHIYLMAQEVLTSEIGRVYIAYTVTGGEDVVIPEDKAVLLSLVVNEILTNILKYAFPDKKQGTVSIVISEEPEQLCLDISDDGVGMPAGLDLSTSESVGLSMIYNLVTVQLGGTIELLEGEGTRYHICIPGNFCQDRVL